MSGPFGAGGLNFFSGERTFYPFSLNNSLRFDDDVSSNLKRTPTTSTNRRTFAWSGWVKRCELGSGQGIFGTATGSAAVERHLETWKTYAMYLPLCIVRASIAKNIVFVSTSGAPCRTIAWESDKCCCPEQGPDWRPILCNMLHNGHRPRGIKYFQSWKYRKNQRQTLW